MRRPARLLLVLATALTGLVLTPVSPAAAATAHQPVLFVHGYDSDASTWDTMVDRFLADGYRADELYAISYDWRQANATTANELVGIVADIEAQTGWDTIDIVTHSMGGLSSRYFLRNLRGAAETDAWVSLGGPNHGTRTAKFCFDTSCRDMRPGSPFLTQLNTGDETPGAVRYATWTSSCDYVIIPQSSTALSGARNFRAGCVDHTDLPDNAAIYAQVRDFIG